MSKTSEFEPVTYTPSAKQIGARKGMKVGDPVKWKNHPDYKWRVDWVEGGKYKRKGFKTKVAAEEWKDSREAELQEHGVQAANLTATERAAVVELRSALEEVGLSVREALSIAIAQRRREQSSCTMAELVQRVVSARERAGQSASHIRDLRSKLGRFSEKFGVRSVATITADEIGSWIHGLALAPASVNSYRRILVVAFNDAISGGFIEEGKNPAMKVKQSKVVEGEVGILTPKQAEALLGAADAEILPAIAIGFFCGLRAAELQRLDWEEVRLDLGHVRVKASKAKSARNRIVPISDNLRAWIAPHAKANGPVWPANGRKLFEAARLAVGFGSPKEVAKSEKAKEKNPEKKVLLEWPDNALRHSFATYHLAHHKNAAELALHMGHTSPALIFAHYREVVCDRDGAAYWRLRPEPAKNGGAMRKAV